MKIITGILMSIMMFMMSFTEIQAYNSTWIEDDTINPYYIQDIEIDFIEVNSSGSYIGNVTAFSHWHQMSNGYVVFDLDNSSYDFTALLDDGYYKLSPQPESAYKYVYMFGLEFNNHDYTYHFEVLWSTSSEVYLYWVSTDDPAYENSSGNDVDVNVKLHNASQQYIYAYNSSYSILYGYENGREDGYANGLADGREEFGRREGDTLYNANLWGALEYQRGVSQGQADTLSLQNMIPGVLGVMIAFFFQMASISVLGISVLDILVLFFGIAVVLLVFKTFVK